MEMTFQELCLNPPHSGSANGKNIKSRQVWFAVLVRTRLCKEWRFYVAYNYAMVHRKADNADDVIEVLRIVPISQEQYMNGLRNTRNDNRKHSHRERLMNG